MGQGLGSYHGPVSLAIPEHFQVPRTIVFYWPPFNISCVYWQNILQPTTSCILSVHFIVFKLEV